MKRLLIILTLFISTYNFVSADYIQEFIPTYWNVWDAVGTYPNQYIQDDDNLYNSSLNDWNTTAFWFCASHNATLVSFELETLSSAHDTYIYNTGVSQWTWYVWTQYIVGSVKCLVPSFEQTFSDIDISYFHWYDQVVFTETWSLDYSLQISDWLVILYEIKVLLMMLVFFVLMWIFYTFINDLLWKN